MIYWHRFGCVCVCVKVYDEQLAAVSQHLINLFMRLRKVTKLWKTSYVVPMSKTGRPSTHTDSRAVALTSLVMKAFERLVLKHLSTLLTLLLSAYQLNITVEDAIIFLNHNPKYDKNPRFQMNNKLD